MFHSASPGLKRYDGRYKRYVRYENKVESFTENFSPTLLNFLEKTM